MQKKTKIIATLGPSSDSVSKMVSLVMSGVNVFRINLSHSSPEIIKQYIEKISIVRKKVKQPVAIMIDTRGPEIRVKKFKNGKVQLKRGSLFSFFDGETLGDENGVAITQKICIKDAKVGGLILANDGRMKFKILKKEPNCLVCKVLTSGELRNNKSLSFKAQHFNFEYLNEEDKKDLKLALGLGIEYISASFVNTKDDLVALKNYVYQYDKDVKIIAKIENQTGLKNLDEIGANCDGLMVARGDLGVEASFEKLPVYQRQIISAAHKHSILSIVATEMLESMITSIRPTRAEISDVAKAVFDGAGAVMLSGESAMGRDPVACVRAMSKILKEAENEFDYHSKFLAMPKMPQSASELVIQSAVSASFFLKVKAIVTYTSKGKSALRLSTRFAKVPVIAITDNEKTYNALALYCGCVPYLKHDERDLFESVQKVCEKYRLAKSGDLVIITTGSTDKIANMMKLETIK